jgi:tRNA(fMet)-specific endonuclease VapC
MLGTNFCIMVLRDRPSRLRARFVAESERLTTSAIVQYELLSGAEKSARPQANWVEVEHFLERIDVFDFDGDAAAHAGNSRRTGTRGGSRLEPTTSSLPVTPEAVA